MKHSMEPRILWIVVQLTLAVTSAPFHNNLSPSEIVALEATLIPQESLVDDLELVQKVNKLEDVSENETSTTVYQHPVTRKVVVSRKGQNDTGLPIVVVDQGSRTFLVLSQSPSNGTKYRVFYGYLRDKATEVNSTYFVEWEGWEDRSMSSPLTRTLGWNICFQSVLPPCKTAVPEDSTKKVVKDYSEDFSGQESSKNLTNANRSRSKLVVGLNGPDYSDLFADLEESQERYSYLQKVVAIYVYTLSAATGAASNQALALAGIRPPVVQNKGQALADLASIRLTDMKRAIALFQQTINESDPSLMESLVPGDEEITENAALVLPTNVEDAKIGTFAGGLIKGGLVGLLLGPNGLAHGSLLRGSGAGGETEGREFQGKAPPQDDDLVGTVLKYALSGGSGQSILGSVAGAVLGADGNGDLIESITGSLLTTPGGADGMAKRATSLVTSLFGGGGIALALKATEDAADSYGYKLLVKKAVSMIQETDLSFAYPAVDLAVSHPPFRAAIEKALQSALKKIPFLGQPLTIITGFFTRALNQEEGGAWGIYSAEPRVETNLFVNIGWRTADLNPEELADQALLVEGDKPFIGLGNCAQKPLNLSNYQALGSHAPVEMVAELWSAMFRNQCSDRHKIQLAKLLEAGLLSVEGGVGSLTLNLSHPFIEKRKLSKPELIQLSAAFEVSVLSQVIISEWKIQDQANSRLASNLTSRTVSGLVKSVLTGLTKARRDVPAHFIKLVRNSATTLKTALTKLLQDYDRYKACSRCGEELLAMARADLREVIGLLHYLLRAMGPIDVGGVQDVEGNYRKFFLENLTYFEDIVKTFL